MARIFSAIDIEDEQALQELKQIRDTLDLGFKPVKTEKMHITLQFFKDISQKQITEVKKGLENIDTDSFKAKIEGIGTFPSEDHIRVIWAGIEHPKIYEIQEKASQHGVKSDSKHEFKPHITLLRAKNISRKQKGKLKKTIEEHRNKEIREIKINKIKLFRSDLTPEGAEYKHIKEKKL